MNGAPFENLSPAEEAMLVELGKTVVVERFLRLDSRNLGVKGIKRVLPLHFDASEAEKLWHAMSEANEAWVTARREARLS